MLSPAKKSGSVAGKLLLSSALVTASLAYGWWENGRIAPPGPAMVPAAVAPKVSASPRPTIATAPVPAMPAARADVSPAPIRDAAMEPAKPGPRRVAKAPAVTLPAQPAAPPPEVATVPPSPSTLTTEAAMQMYLPTDAASPPLPPVTGTPTAGASVPLAAGTHLEDGDYVSDRHQFEWGDLTVKVSIHGGQITGVQILQYPDHRSQSLYLSQMAGPTLESEVIKSQQPQVDIVSSATDTSYAFQDTIANAIMKATRG